MKSTIKKTTLILLSLLGACMFALTLIFAVKPAFALAGNEYIINANEITGDLEITTGKTMLSEVRSAQAPDGVANVKYTTLVDEEDYTSDDDTTVLTLKKEYLKKLENGTYYITARYLGGDYVVKINIVNDGWVVRKDKGSVTDNGNYVDVTLNRWDPDMTVAGRGFYSEPLDITKPVFIEVANFTQGEWLMFNLNDEPFSFEYFDQTDSTPGKVKLIYFPFSNTTGEGYRLQGWKGFSYTTGAIGIGDRVNTYNSNVFEIFIGETKEESYVRYNGVKVSAFSTSVSRADFEGNVAYLGIMTAQSDDAKFTTNKRVNSVTAIFDDTVRETAYELKSSDDLFFKVANLTDGALTVKYNGNALTAGTDYTLEGDTVCLKGSYLKKLPYTSMLNFQLESGNTKSNVYFKTEVVVSDRVKIADDDTIIKYSDGGDIEYRFVLDGEKFVGVVNANTDTALNANDYTFENGKLVIKRSAVSVLANGSYKMYLETENCFVPFYIVNETFEKGIKYISGNSGAKIERTKVAVNEANGILLNEIADFSKGQKWKINVSSVGDYYKSGKSDGSADSYIEYKFYDFNTFNYIVLRIRANADPNDSSMRFKTWIDFAVVNKDGVLQSLALNINSKASTVGEHVLEFVADEDSLKVVFDDSYDLTLENLQDMNLSMMQLFVNTTSGYSWTMQNASLDTTALEEAFKKAEGKSSAEELLKEVNALGLGATQAQVDDYTAKLNKVAKKKGCGSSVIGTAGMAIFALFATAYVCIKRK
mgnify:CR=1 FL=1